MLKVLEASSETDQKHNSDSHILAKEEWDVFCTFTFNGEPPPYSIQKRCIFELTRRVAKQVYKVKSPLWDMRFGIRFELGEKTLRPHWHAIFAGYKSSVTSSKTTKAYQVKHIWENQVSDTKKAKSNVGHACVRAYDSSKPGAAYICKEALSARDFYELKKFRDGFEQHYGENTVTVLLGSRLLLEIAKRKNRLHKCQGFAHFLRDLKAGNSKAERWTQKRKGGFNYPKGWPHPADQTGLRLFC